MTVAKFKRVLKNLVDRAEGGCGNHGCKLNPPRGQGTNAICQCERHFARYLLDLAIEVEKRLEN